VLIDPAVQGRSREHLITAAKAGAELDPVRARYARAVEYTVPDRDGESELICVLTTILDISTAPAQALAEAYHERWQHEGANDQIKTHLRGPGRVLRSKSPDMVRQEIYGYLLTHYAVAALICRAATEADIDPDRIKFKRTVRILRRRATDPAAFSPQHQQRTLTALIADITAKRNLNPHRTYPRVIKRGRHNSYRIKKPGDTGTRHNGPPTIQLANIGHISTNT
jgi:hypothetical protein